MEIIPNAGSIKTRQEEENRTADLANAAANNAEVKSETVGSYSRTLATGGESALSALNATDGAKKLLAETCMEYLAHTGLLYRGGGCCGCTRPTL